MKRLIVDINKSYKETVIQLLSDNWGSDFMVTKGQIHHYKDLDGYVAIENGKIVGVLTFRIFDDEVEIISLDSFKKNTGVGNDNLNALRFYQKRNWSITALHKDAVTKARKIKPTISITGYYDIPLRHEIELEYEP